MRTLTTLIFFSLIVCPGLAQSQPASSDEARAAVIEQLRRQDLQRAEAICREWLETHGSDVDITHMLGLIRLSLAEQLEQRGAEADTLAALRSESRELLERAESLGSGRALPDIDHALGFIYLTEGRPAQAKARLDAAIAAQPGRAKLYMLRGNAQLQLHHTAAGEADLRRAIELEPGLFDAHLLHATALFRLGRAAEANATLEDLYASLEGPPGERHWLLLYDLSRYAGNDLERARGHLEAAKAIAPGRALTRGQLGIVYYQLGQLEHARSELDFVLSRSGVPDDVLTDALHYRGLLAKHSREFEAARDYFLRALTLVPTRSETLKAYSSVLRQLGEKQQAAEVLARFRQIVEIENEVKRLTDRLLVQPRQPALRVNLIRLLIRLDRDDEARAELARFKRQFPSSPAINELEGALSREG